jgi:hypothetical protein
MMRLIAIAFALAAAATSAQAALLAPLHQPDGMITQVREACGLLPAGTPPGVRLECEQLAAVALSEVPRLANPKKFKQGDVRCVICL